ncbi:LAYN [Mytilus edulis]|uniref:LAYN n=1 Tax=Mytilus edulis TaxID=6550 RepID=A0A8S3SWE7_MYTED|nr:LAYN [Mytilus edulis]
MQTDNCFWTTFNSGTCALLSISKTDIDKLPLIDNNGGLSTYQMIRGCSEKACRLSDWCKFIEDDGYCIKYYVDGLEYDSARTVCRRDGGELLRIDSPQKQTTVEHILNVFQVYVPVTVRNKETIASQWLFDDGTAMRYSNWNKPKQPTNNSQELYIYLKPEANWQWNDISPGKNLFFASCAHEKILTI